MVSFRSLIIFALLMSSLNVWAKPTPSDCKEASDVEEQAGDMLKVAAALPGQGCADPMKLKGICFSLAEKFKAPDSSEYVYDYEQKLADAACVKEGESEETAQLKVKMMWEKLEDPHLKCSGADFEIQNGTILKYALSKNNYDFIELAIQQYKVNLNVVDKSDNRTLLDFINDRIQKAKGTEQEKVLRRYYDRLRRGGAKLRSEL